MAKAVKKAAVKKRVAPVALPKIDTTELKGLLIDLENLVPGSGTVEDRQMAVDKLKAIINKLEA